MITKNTTSGHNHSVKHFCVFFQLMGTNHNSDCHLKHKAEVSATFTKLRLSLKDCPSPESK